MPGTWGFKGDGDRVLEFPPGAADTELAPNDRARIKYNEVAGELQLSVGGGPYISFGNPSDIDIDDNDASAFRVHESANNYIVISTLNAAEAMTFGDATSGHVTPTFKFVCSTTLQPAQGNSFAVVDQNGEYYISMDSTTGNEAVYLGSRTAPGLASVEVIMSDNYFRSFYVYQISAGPTRNDYIICDTTNGAERTILGNTGATRPACTIQVPDNLATAFQLREATSDYIAVDTTNGSESIHIGASAPINTKVLLAASNGRIGFFGTSAIAKPTVTGAKGGNAALTSLVSTLASFGLIVDGTS